MSEESGQADLRLGKTLPLSQEDIDAIPHTLPGKWLNHAAALLAAVALMLGNLKSVNDLWEWPSAIAVPEPWRYAFNALPSLVLVLYLFNLWLSHRERRQSQYLAMKSDAVAHGFFRVGPYRDTAEDQAAFDRADRAHQKVLDWLLRSVAVPLYLTGDSGSGKSSLLNAYVLPQLRQQGWTVVSARAWQDPAGALRAALAAYLASRKKPSSDPPPLRELIDSAVDRSHGKLVLVIDQFEEFIILAQPQAQSEFAALLAALEANPLKGLRILLVVRSEYQAALADFGLPLLNQERNWFQVGRFSLKDARQFMERSGLDLKPDTLDQILQSAAELDDSAGLIRPITLNVVGHVLVTGERKVPTLDAGELVRRYIQDALDQDGLRAHFGPIVRLLVTEQGTKRPQREAELMQATGCKLGQVRSVMNGLRIKELARPLDEVQTTWELSHDFIARALSIHLGRHRTRLWRQAVAYAAPALAAALLAGGGIYEQAVAVPERQRRAPHPDILADEYWSVIPAGEFCMGSRKNETDPVAEACRHIPVDPDAQDDERPLHLVRVAKPFRLARHEVTIEEYTRFLNDTRSNFTGDDGGFGAEQQVKPEDRGQMPVINVSWEGANAYARWLSEKTHAEKPYRLPTEAEWEYAARAGTVESRYWG
jgi:hypothetical protein